LQFFWGLVCRVILKAQKLDLFLWSYIFLTGQHKCLIKKCKK